MNFLGENLLVWLVLALGAALAVGNLLALIRPKPESKLPDSKIKAPLVRSIFMIVLGTLASIWALATLLT